MTKAINRVRLRLGPTQGTVVRAFFELEAIRALLDLRDAVAAQHAASCIVHDDADPDRDRCVGQYHAVACPVAQARRAVSDLSDRIDEMP